MARPKPLTFQIRPPTQGINVSEPPTDLDLRETPRTMNTRFARGVLQMRQGFKKKYAGADESILWIDTLYSGGFTNVIAITAKAAYYLDSATDSLKLMSVWDGADSPSVIAYPQFTMENLVSYISIDIGEGLYAFKGANGGNTFPSDVNTTIADLLVLVNGTADGIFVFAYTGQSAPGTPAEGEVINPDNHPGAPAGGRSVAIFDNRIFIGGDENEPSTIRWSAKQNFHQWDAPNGGGFRVLGDSPDWIQAMKRLGEYLIVYKERSIYIGQTTGLNDPPVRFEAAPGQGIGLAAPNSIGDLGEEHIFLGWDNIYVFSLRAIKAVGTKIREELFFGEYGILPEYLGNCTGIIAEEFGEYWLFIPTGRWPRGSSSGNDIPEIANLIENPAFNFDPATNGWSVGTFTWSEETVGVRFGLNTGQVAASNEIGTSGLTLESVEYSCVLWAFGTAPEQARISLRDVSDVEVTGYTIDIMPESSRYVFSFTGTGITQLVIENLSATDPLFVDAVHLVSLDGVDDIYIYTETNGYKSVGFLNAFDNPQPIPFISRAVGEYMPDTVWVYNYEYDAWSVWRLPMTGFGYDSIQGIITVDSIEGLIAEQNWRFDEKRLQDLAPTNLIAQPDGQIYEMRKEMDHDWDGVMSVPVSAYWESKDFDLDAPHIDKTLSRILLYHDPTHPAVTLDVAASTDSGFTWEEQQITIDTGKPQTIVDFFVTGSQVRFRVKGESPGFFLNGFGVKLIPRGESHAY